MMKRILLSLLSVVACATWVHADYRLPNQPVGADGYYIVKWDCEKNDWATSNDMEYDETFVLAIDLTGTEWENWVKSAQSSGGVNYPVDNTIVSLNTFLGGKGTEYTDNRARLWHIRDNIYGALYNFAQFEIKGGGTNPTPTIGEKTKIYSRIFKSATLFSDRCYPIEPSADHKKGSVWGYEDKWFSKTDNQPLFVFAPYTGTKTGALFTTQEMTPGTYIFYDKDHYVVSKGYAAPCSVNDDQCCPFFQPLDPVEQTYRVGATATLTMVKTSGNLEGVTYQWYRYPTASGEGAAAKYGTNSKTCNPATDVDGSDYTYYCFVTTSNCPDGVYSTRARVIIQNPCPQYTWSIDGVEGLTTPMYPGGWYMVSCTSDAGAPTISIKGTNITMATPTTKGDTTTAKVTLQGNATGDIQFAAAAPVSTSFRQCKDTQLVTVGNCEGGDAYRIEWDSQNGKYMIDNAGQVGLYSSVTDKTDLWQPIYTGEIVGGQPVMYLYNLGSHRYLYRGPVQLTGNNNTEGTWDFGAVLTSSTNARTGDYKWIIYPDGDYRYIICVSGWNSGNWNRSFGIHYRNSSMGYMFCSGNDADKHDLKVCTPYLVCGKMDGQTGDPNMRSHKNKITTIQAAPEHVQVSSKWSGTAPADTIRPSVGDEMTYTAVRSDNIHSINTTITYQSTSPQVATVDATTGKVTVVGSGITTIKAVLEDVGCFDGDSLSYVIKVKGCSPFEWAIDGTAGTTTLMYPGGWYMVSCTSADGAPDITVSGTGVSSETAVKSGNTTTIKVILQGNASDDITLKASLSSGGMTCEDTQTITVSACTETAAESRKIEWFNFNGTTQFPQYWIHEGASVFLRDNNGVLEADIEHQDGNDQWYISYTGEMCQGQSVFYLQNVQTQRYVYRGTTTGNTGQDWEYAEALLSDVNAQSDEYKWVLYENSGDTAIVNIKGFTGTNLTNGAYVLHVRNWEVPTLFNNPNVTSPRMVCGKMANQGGSPVFYIKGYTTTKPITPFQTQLNWKATAPTDTIVSQQGNTFTYLAERTDTLHSINKKITYESLDPTIATVNANTGAVTVVASDGETIIRAILEEVGCFKSDTISYVIRLYDCTKDITTHNDYQLPRQPKADDCSYIVRWDCATNTWATSNDMEWGETFVFAVNLAGTPLGDWVMKGSGRTGVVRSVAFDRFLERENTDRQLHLDASRLWHIRDTIFGATYNFSQIPYTNSQSYTPAQGEQTPVMARLFGFETATGGPCNQAGTNAAGKWYEWSNSGTMTAQWTGQWLENTYVSSNEQYLFRFAPYTGKTDPTIKTSDDDSRDQWYDGHYFTLNGYHSPCPTDWPEDQAVTADKPSICFEKSEQAVIQLAGSEIGWTYTLWANGQPVSGSETVGTGSALSWTTDSVATYSVMAVALDATNHSAAMGLCSTSQVQLTATPDCVEPEVCYDMVYRKWNDLLFVDNSQERYTAYQWYCDGQPIAGATRQFLYTEGVILSGDGHTYRCDMTTTNGSIEKSCEHLFADFPASVLSSRPSVVSRRTFSVSGHLLNQDEPLAPGCYIQQSTDSEGVVHVEKLIVK